jgi:hypothetical protein
VSRLRRVIGAHDWTEGVRVYYLKMQMHTVTDSPDSLNLSPASSNCFKVVPLTEGSMCENSHTAAEVFSSTAYVVVSRCHVPCLDSDAA